MAFDYLVILIFPSKSVAHAYKQPCSLASGLLSMNVDAKMRSKVRHEREFTIISHRIKIQSHQVRQKERIATRIPGSISDIHGVRAVCAAARRRQAVLRRHGRWLGGSSALPLLAISFEDRDVEECIDTVSIGSECGRGVESCCEMLRRAMFRWFSSWR